MVTGASRKARTDRQWAGHINSNEIEAGTTLDYPFPLSGDEIDRLAVHLGRRRRSFED